KQRRREPKAKAARGSSQAQTEQQEQGLRRSTQPWTAAKFALVAVRPQPESPMRARLATGAITADPAFCPLWSGWPIDSSLFAPLEARATVRPESLDARSCCQQIPSGLTRPDPR